MTFTIIGAVAELERSLIAERVRVGIRNARAKGRVLGRPRAEVSCDQIRELLSAGNRWNKSAVFSESPPRPFAAGHLRFNQ